MACIQLSVFMVSLFLLQLLSGTLSSTFTVTNKCTFKVWPAILSGAGIAQLPETGFTLPPGQSTSISVPVSWSGRFWGRTLCDQDPGTGKFSCVTGDCTSGNLQCSGSGAIPPATLAEFTLNGAGGMDFYDVSLVDGFNLPMTIAPQGGTGGNCTVTECSADLNKACRKELRVVEEVNDEIVVGCKSACEAFGEPQYCCSGAYSTPEQCKPSSYSMFFKNACPKAYSYAYDDGSSTFTCKQADYVITFCPGTGTSASTIPAIGNSANPGMLKCANPDCSASSRQMKSTFIGSATIVFAAVWQLWQLL